MASIGRSKSSGQAQYGWEGYAVLFLGGICKPRGSGRRGRLFFWKGGGYLQRRVRLPHFRVKGMFPGESYF